MTSFLETEGTNKHTQNTSTTRTSNYFAAILWTTAGLSLFRFIGSLWFLGKSGILCCVSRR